MTLTSSFPIKLTDIGAEYQDSAPHSLTEFLRNGNLVSSTKTVTTSAVATATNFSSSVVQRNRGEPYSYQPAANPTAGSGAGCLYRHVLWADNGGSGSTNQQFNIDVTGTYSFSFFQYIGNDGNVVGNYTVKAAGTTVATFQATFSGARSSNGNFTATAGDLIEIDTTWNSAGWSGNYVFIGGTGAASSGRTVTGSSTSNVNSNVATSAPVSMSQFLGGERG